MTKSTSDITSLIRQQHSLRVTKLIADRILKQPELLKELFQLLKNGTVQEKQRAAWPLAHIAVADVSLFKPYLKNLIQLLNDNSHDAIKRNALKVLELSTLPKQVHAQVIEKCFPILINHSEAVAIRVYAMGILFQLCKTYPELGNELKSVIEADMEYGTPGYQSRARKVLAGLKKLTH